MRVSTRARVTTLIAAAMLICGCYPKLNPKKGAPAAGQGQATPDPKPKGLQEQDVTGDEAAAKAILDEMMRAYANAESYADECHTQIETQVTVEKNTFKFDIPTDTKTAFARPDSLRVEMFAQSPFGYGQTKHIMFAGGDQSIIVVDGLPQPIAREDGKTDPESLRKALHTTCSDYNPILSLLIPDLEFEEKSLLESLTEVRVYGEDTINGVVCHKLHGTLELDAREELEEYATWDLSDDIKVAATVTMWIAKDTKLLHRLIENVKFEDLGNVETLMGGEAAIPTMRLWSRADWTPQLNPQFAWHQLLANFPGHPGDPVWGWRAQDKDFTPSKKDAKESAAFARKILKKTLEKYASAKTYRDTGAFSVAPVLPESMPERTLTFQTAFKRPSKFTYLSEEEKKTKDDKDAETTRTHRRHVWRSGNAAKVWGTQDPGVQEYDSLGMPLEAVSRDADSPVAWIAGLLLPDEARSSFLVEPEEITLLGYQDINGSRCYKLSGSTPGNTFFNVWIDKKKKLIRRIEIKYPGLGRPAYCSADYDPELNKDIPEDQLEFQSPPSPDA